MNQEKMLPLAKGVIKHLPYVKKIMSTKTGGSDKSRYCYSVWLRHLMKWSQVNNELPNIVAELGPGDSLGIGLSALLSGCKKLHALDVVQYWDDGKNLQILNELVALFNNRCEIPDNIEYPKVRPEIDSYDFPSSIISDIQIKESLRENRVTSIRKELEKIDDPKNSLIKCNIPWSNSNIIESNSIDFIFSQAVLEHVEDLDNTYKSMQKWLQPYGLMSHTIDFKSHGSSKSWNGHWTYSDLEWKIVKGGKNFLINRCPLSTHIDLHAKYGFTILEITCDKMITDIRRKHLAQRFKELSEKDLITSGVHILSRNDKLKCFNSPKN
jgi:hypothetical protein